MNRERGSDVRVTILKISNIQTENPTVVLILNNKQNHLTPSGVGTGNPLQ